MVNIDDMFVVADNQQILVHPNDMRYKNFNSVFGSSVITSTKIPEGYAYIVNLKHIFNKRKISFWEKLLLLFFGRLYEIDRNDNLNKSYK